MLYTLKSAGPGGAVSVGGRLITNCVAVPKPGVPNTYGLIQGEANAIVARKKPLSSMTPTLVLKDGKLWFAVGSPGGGTIINTVLQVIVNVVDFGYMPSVVRIHVGQTVVWQNGGRELHDVTGDDDWHSGPIEGASAYRHTFGFEGIFTYRCSVHPDMRGTINHRRHLVEVLTRRALQTALERAQAR